MASSSSSAAAAVASASASANNEGNRADIGNPPVAVAPPHAWPQPPPAAAHSIFVQQIYGGPVLRQTPQPRELPSLRRTMMWSLLVFLVTAVFCFLIWVFFQPTFPQLHVASATISNFTITSTTATAECNLTLLLTNSKPTSPPYMIAWKSPCCIHPNKCCFPKITLG